jgi:hypothetical protein
LRVRREARGRMAVRVLHVRWWDGRRVPDGGHQIIEVVHDLRQHELVLDIRYWWHGRTALVDGERKRSGAAVICILVCERRSKTLRMSVF